MSRAKLKIGQSIPQRPKYKIIDFIQEGGFADIYLAQNTITRRKVVLKLFRLEEFNTSQQAENYLRREMAFIDIQSKYSPYTLKLIDKIIDKRNTNNPRLGLILNYINGPDLQDWFEELKEKPPSNIYLYLTKNIFYPLSKYLAYCHGHGILHRDLSLGNIIITKVKKRIIPVVIDWGAGLNFDPAKLFDYPPLLEDMPESEEEQIYTEGFCPPEIDLNKGLNCQSDIYSLGALMYYCLTFGKTREEIKAKRDYILNPNRHNMDCPISLQKIVIKATQYEPRDRYLSFEAMGHDLRQALRDWKKKGPK